MSSDEYIKYARGTLSGGGISRLDKFPNYMSFTITMSAPNAFTNDQIVTPISRLSRGGKKVTIMELLWIDFQYQGIDLRSIAENLLFGLSTGASPTIPLLFGDPETLMADNVTVQGGTALPSASHYLTFPRRYDFQTQDGLGLLMATDTFNAWASSSGQTGPVTVSARLFYRFVEVGVTEYIGIVQSQQQN